jgi:hypothetical protein
MIVMAASDGMMIFRLPLALLDVGLERPVCEHAVSVSVSASVSVSVSVIVLASELLSLLILSSHQWSDTSLSHSPLDIILIISITLAMNSSS